MKPIVSIVMGSDSDLPVMKDAAEMLESLGVSVEVSIVSAHRTPDRLMEFSKKAHERGIEVIIAGAGGAAHLPGMVAALSPLPVIGVPILSSNSIDGWDSILSILQMPGGVPVATVALNGAKNAGILAAQIIGVKHTEVRDKILTYKESLTEAVNHKIEKLDSKGYRDYLKG
jgi:5-(carboxyamino)imidazole ribonucleotide mutase